MADQPILSPAMQAQLESLLGLSSQRVASQQPIHQAAMAMAQHLAPDYAQAAMGPVPTVPSGGGNLLASPSGSSGGLGALAALAGAGSSSSFDLSKIGALLKKLFGGGGPSVQGNKPFAGGINNPTGNNPFNNNFQGWQDPFQSDPFAAPILPSDPGFYVGGGQPSDPSGGSGIGPGMRSYYGDGDQASWENP